MLTKVYNTNKTMDKINKILEILVKLIIQLIKQIKNYYMIMIVIFLIMIAFRFNFQFKKIFRNSQSITYHVRIKIVKFQENNFKMKIQVIKLVKKIVLMKWKSKFQISFIRHQIIKYYVLLLLIKQQFLHIARMRQEQMGRVYQ